MDIIHLMECKMHLEDCSNLMNKFLQIKIMILKICKIYKINNNLI